MFPRFLVLAAAALVLASPGRAGAAKVVGRVVVSESFRRQLADAESKGPALVKGGYWNEPNAVRDVEPPYVSPATDLGIALSLEGAPAPKADPPTEVNVRAGAMEKRVIVVRPGTNVKFKVLDPIDHELYVPGVDWFRPERQSRGSFRLIEFAKEGVFEVRCRLVPHLRAWVVVAPATHVLPADAGGAFSLDGLVPGKYVLRVFHGGAWVKEHKFEIASERGDVPVEVKLEAAGAAGAEAKPAQAEADKGPQDKPTDR